MPSICRRAFLGAVTTGGIAGCADRLATDEYDTSPADRHVPLSYEPGADEWIRSTRSFANDLVAPAATPPQEGPTERWARRERGRVDHVAVADGVVFAGGPDGVEARGLEDGARLWSDDRPGGVVVIDGRCYTQLEETLIARDASTGEEEWRHELPDRSRDLVEIDGTVYCTTDGDLHGLHADTGDHRWTIDSDGVRGTLAVANNRLHWVTWEAYHILSPNGPHRPAERKIETIPLDGFESWISPSRPAVVDGTIALGGESEAPDPKAPIRTLSTRGTVWQRPFEPSVSTPAILEDRLLVSGYDNNWSELDESAVGLFDLETGDHIWEETVPEPAGPPAVADGLCYLGGSHPESARGTGRLFALEVETGAVRWELETAGAFGPHPLALVEDAIVLGTREGVVVLE